MEDMTNCRHPLKKRQLYFPSKMIVVYYIFQYEAITVAQRASSFDSVLRITPRPPDASCRPAPSPDTGAGAASAAKAATPFPPAMAALPCALTVTLLPSGQSRLFCRPRSCLDGPLTGPASATALRLLGILYKKW